MSSHKIVITGGGTGGHVFPALAIAEELKSRGHEILFVGTSHGMEARLVPDKGFRFHAIQSGQVKNQSALKILKTLFQLVLGVFSCVRLFRRERPAAVIGFGGYVSVPACLAAWCLRIPLFLQEQNVSVGIANRFLGCLSTEVFLGFDKARSAFNPRKCVTTGNPLRKTLSAEKIPPHRPNARFLMIMGGSLGARAINEAVVANLERLQKAFPGVTILHQTGVKDHESVQSDYRRLFQGDSSVLPFIEDMAEAYAKASLIVARSGALTVSELIEVGRPAVLVPYPRRGQNDQVDNARMLEKKGAARVVEQGADFNERFWAALQETFKPEILTLMAKSYSRLRTTEAAVSIGDRIERRLDAPERSVPDVQKDQ